MQIHSVDVATMLLGSAMPRPCSDGTKRARTLLCSCSFLLRPDTLGDAVRALLRRIALAANSLSIIRNIASNPKSVAAATPRVARRMVFFLGFAEKKADEIDCLSIISSLPL